MSWRGHKKRGAPPNVDVSAELRTATVALEAYDYDGAEAALSHAFERSDGALEAARPWIAHLVDNVADDVRALSLAADLSEESLSDPDVRLLLAVAASRCGERSVARSWLAGVRVPAAADAWWALGRAAASAGQLDEVREALDEIHVLDPSNPGAVALADALEAARRDARAPAEARLLRLRDEEQDADRVLEAAHEVLQDHPKSEVASRLIAQLSREQRHGEAVAAADEASQQLTAGHGGAALASFERARRLGLETMELSHGLAAARSMAEDQELTRQAAHVASLLEAADDETRGAALLALLALSEAGRARVEGQVEIPELEWLVAMAAPRGGSQAKRAVRAALAIGGSVTALRCDEPALAVALLEPQRRWVERCPEGQALLARARRRIAEQERARVEDVLDEVARLLDESSVEAARDALARVPATGLRAEQQARRAELSSRVEAEAERRRLERGVEEATARGRLSNAISICHELAQSSGSRAEVQWRARAEELDARLHRLLCFRVVPPDEAEGAGPPVRTSGDEISRALAAGGGSAYVLRYEGRWTLVCRLDVTTGVTERAASLIFLEGRCPELCVTLDHVEIVAGNEIVRLCLDLGRVVGHHRLEHGGPHEVCEQLLVTDGEMAWTMVRHAETHEQDARLVCLRTHRVLRTRPGGFGFITGGGEHDRICIDAYQDGVQVYDVGGRRVCRGLPGQASRGGPALGRRRGHGGWPVAARIRGYVRRSALPSPPRRGRKARGPTPSRRSDGRRDRGGHRARWGMSGARWRPAPAL